MTYTLIEAGPARAAQRSLATLQDGLDAAEAAWASGKADLVRLVGPDGALLWKRGTSPDASAEAADNAALAEAAGLARLRLACPAIGGLMDLERPLAPFARSVEVEGPDDAEGRGSLLHGSQGSARLRDLLAHLDARLADEARDATLTAYAVIACDWPDPGHHRLSVTLA